MKGRPGLDLRVSGSLLEPVISGTIHVHNTLLRLPVTDPLAVEMRPVGMIDPRLDLRCIVGQNVRVTNNLLSASFYTNEAEPIRITGSLGSPVLNGRLLVSSGKLALPTARFRLAQGGRVDLRYPVSRGAAPGEAGLDVSVDLSATSSLSAVSVTGVRRRYQVTMEVKGSLTDASYYGEPGGMGGLKVTFRAQPPDLALSQAGVTERVTALLGGQGAIEAAFSRRGAEGAVLMGQAIDYLGEGLISDLLDEIGLRRSLHLEDVALDYSESGALVFRLSKHLAGPFDMTYWRRISGRRTGVDEAGQWELRIGVRLPSAFRLSYSLSSTGTNAYLLEGVYSF